MPLFKVRVGIGNGTRERTVLIEADNANDAKDFAEAQTGGRALGASQTSEEWEDDD